MSSSVLPRSNASGITLRRSTRLLRPEKLAAFTTEATIDKEMDLNEAPQDEGKSKSRKRKRGSRLATMNSDEDGENVKKPRKRPPPKPEPVYIIPDVERKETTFKGRLGYACLNTILRDKRPVIDSVFCSRTCRLDSINKNGIEWVKDLGRKNVRDLITVIQWNEDNLIRFLRLSSEMFPFSSHERHGYSLDYCSGLLKEAGDLANKYGHRLTTHPGQFTQLGSPNPKVINAAVRELDYHCQMLDLMGIGADGVMVVHGGGKYGDKPSAIERIKKTIREILRPNVRARLVLENDEMCYNAEDLLAICEELDVPFVFDYHHDMLNPSSISPSEIIKRADVIWKRRGIRPKQHLSEPRPGAVTLMERRAHSDRCETLPRDLPDDMDLMIEAKDKEQAVFHLYRIYGLAPVIHANLRPPNPQPTKETQGRKSNKRTSRVQGTELRESGLPGANDTFLSGIDNEGVGGAVISGDSLGGAASLTEMVENHLVDQTGSRQHAPGANQTSDGHQSIFKEEEQSTEKSEARSLRKGPRRKREKSRIISNGEAFEQKGKGKINAGNLS